MLDNSKWDVVGDKVIEDDFYRQDHRLLFRVVSRLATSGNPIDVITVSEELQRLGELENAGGMGYLAELAEKTPSASNVRSYANIVHERAVLRRLIQVSGEISDSAFNPTGRSTNELLDDAERKVFKISESSAGQESGPSSVNPVLTKTLERIEELFDAPDGITGVTTGFKDLDDMTSGLQPSDLIILAGRPAMGKTSLATNIAFNIAEAYEPEIQPDGTSKAINGGIVGFFSLEMAAEQLATRIIAEQTEISSSKIRRGEINDSEFEKLVACSQMMHRIPLYIDQTGGISIAQLAARARRLKRQRGLDVLIIDYIQLMQGSKRTDNRVQEITEITTGLKALAKELNVPIIALSQLSRQVENRDDKRPQLSDLRESGSIEQDADVVLFVYRDEYYLQNREPDFGTTEYEQWQVKLDAARGKADVIIAKQRHGPTGTAQLSFTPEFTRFADLIDDDHLPERFE